MPREVPQHIGTDFVEVSSSEGLEIEQPCTGKAQEVFSVSLRIAFQLREYQIGCVQREELESRPRGIGEHAGQPARIVGRRRRDSNMLEIQSVLAIEPGVHARKVFEVIGA